MNNMNMETEKSSRKKLLIPLVVLLLCAVSLIGAGYAYTTSVQNTGTVDAQYYAIDMYKTNTGTLTTEALTLDEKIEVYSEKVVGQNKIQIKATAIDATPLCYVGAWLNSETIATNANITMAVDTESDGWTASGSTVTNSAYGVTLTFNKTDTDNNGYQEVTVAVSAINYESPVTDAHAATKAVSDAIDGLVFTLTFTCSGITA